MRKVHVIQHVEIEPLGIISDVLEMKNIQTEHTHVYRGDTVPTNLDGAGALILMGGPMGANDFDEYPTLLDELRLIGVALERRLPLLGICLGSQLIATALGESVYPGEKKEIGWHQVIPSHEAANDPLMSNLREPFAGLHWHGDIFDLPADAELLASSAQTECQAFRYEENVYGFLFHMEITEQMIADWTHHFADEAEETGQTSDKIRSQSRELLPQLHERGRQVFERWAELVQ
jgi:GMP synthase (glutamine-hydrolysing)